jgi:hyperosmotically inducible periplasmic protein
MKFLFALVLIGLIAFGVYYFNLDEGGRGRAKELESEVTAGAERVKNAVRDSAEKFSLRSDDIKAELAKSGTVVRRKAEQVSAAIADATADTRITAKIKSKLVADKNLSALKISVDTTNGVVTLSGSVASHEEIGQAMLLALETEGVQEVISTLQVRGTKESLQK